MRLKLKQWKGRFALFLALCMIMLLPGCGRETSGAGTSGAQTPETRATAVEASGAGTSSAETPETKAATVEASGAGTSGAEMPETQAVVEASGGGASGTETPETKAAMEASGAGTSGAKTPETKAAAEASQTGTSGAETPETQIVGDPTQKDEPNDLRTEQKASIDEEGSYTTAEDVSLYLHTYEKLPNNFITKKEANALGWSGGSLEPYAPGKCIGGDKFGNYEGVLPDGSYHECDIDTLGAKSRGAKRLVYSEDGRIYYTEDHYTTFTMLYD